MFEKWRIKEHMEITDAAGSHLGTVDSVDGDVIKLTRSDSGDGQHHYVDVKWVDKIEDNRAWLKTDAPLRDPGSNQHEVANAAATAQARSQISDRQQQGYDGQAAEDAGFAGIQPGADTVKPDTPLFGTSGRGTGMGGSGTS